MYLEKLESRLRLRYGLGPNTQDHTFMILRQGCIFEGFGTADEDWNEVWHLELPKEQYFWKSTEGYRPGNSGLHMTFRARTSEGVCNQALQYLDVIDKLYPKKEVILH